MTLDPKKREGYDEKDAKFLEIVEKYGWHVMSVAPRVGGEGDVFSYSTGLFLRTGQPEVIICGLDPTTSAHIINEIGRQLQSGLTFKTDQQYGDIFANEVKCQFRTVHIAHYSEYVCWTQWFYEGEFFPVSQCFWPDRRGLFPWDEGCHSEVITAQPLLFHPPKNVI